VAKGKPPFAKNKLLKISLLKISLLKISTLKINKNTAKPIC
jgi:hypothetical protein